MQLVSGNVASLLAPMVLLLVLAKGADLIALKIREIAKEHGVPIIDNKPLARSLDDSVEIEKLIPPQFYRAVAEIICQLHLGKQKPLAE